MGLGRGIRTLFRLAVVAGVVAPALSLASNGGIMSSIETRTYEVEGTTASGLVRYMDTHPAQGDHGAALASIHPDYQMSLTTRQSGDICVPAIVGVHVDFELTLPEAASPGQMSGRTRSAWNGFLAFARAHEAHHKASYIACATAFVTQARRQSASECFALEATLRGMLAQMKRDCEAKQVPFDRAQARALVNLRLFATARYQRPY
jgi:predicted secreted Zn-dependent protease